MRSMLIRRVALAAMLFAASASHAALRSPQVPVSGTSLQAFFSSQGQAINAATDQLELQTTSFAASSTFEIDGNFPSNSSTTIGLYNAGAAVPALYQVWPGSATNGWFAIASFRTAPTRLVVTLFDASSAFQGSTTYLAGPPDPTFMGIYVQQPAGVT